jgi:hypothetical protein
MLPWPRRCAYPSLSYSDYFHAHLLATTPRRGPGCLLYIEPATALEIFLLLFWKWPHHGLDPAACSSGQVRYAHLILLQ